MVASPLIEVEPLRTILNLECQKGYFDTAVIGGLDRYLAKWSRQNRGKIISPKHLVRFEVLRLSHPDYVALDKENRKLWIDDFLAWLTEVEEVTSVTPKEKKQVSSRVVVSKRSPHNTLNTGSGGGLESSVTIVKGIKANLAAKLSKLGIETIRDLLYFFPRRHLDYSQRKCIAELEIGQEQTILANVWEARVARLGVQQGTEVILGDETGNVRAVWFNQPYLAKRFPTNAQIAISGKVAEFKGRPVFESPEWEIIEDKELIHAGRLVPVYPLTSGLYSRQVRNLVKRAVDGWAGKLGDFLPQDTKRRCQLLDLPKAIIQAHYPDDQLMKNAARRRLAFDELFLIQLGVLSKKRNWQEGQPGNAFAINMGFINKFLGSLPFSLTRAQKRVLQEILSDLKQAKPMSRLLQGEVGSGKTVVAMTALLAAVDSGYQGALMAPTEILAEQHYYNICRFLSRLSGEFNQQDGICCYDGLFSRSITFSLLIGKMGEREKMTMQQRICDGEIDIVIGTHALIQKGVGFNKLGLVVIDEQHRFGVLQRSALRQKGFNPHVLVMTATPIPRTLALTLYGDLDLSVIDELPPGRQVIKTRWLRNEQRGEAYNFIQGQVAAGHQTFIICPLIEESDNIEAKAAVAEYERLSSEIFPNLRLGLLHGRMANDEKDETMKSFRDGSLDILVSTPVVEVGIDVPNATVMLIEAADRFGLSQLHQFRGRVGRGESQSYCLLISENPSLEGQARLEAIEKIYDGFALAEKDLELRGPGEFFGTKQSGLPDLLMAKLSDIQLLELARNEALSIFQSDPGLKLLPHHLLASELARVWPNSSEWS
jgi:ATP-dependent DNA helicase RecG